MSSGPDNETGELEQMRRTLSEEFEEILRGQESLDAVDRESLLRRFQDALNDPAALSAPVDAEKMQADVAEALGLMQRHGLVDADGSGAMGEVFANALKPLQDASVQRTMEFARRCREDGQDSARAWLAEQADATQGQQSIPAHVASALKPADARKRR